MYTYLSEKLHQRLPFWTGHRLFCSIVYLVGLFGQNRCPKGKHCNFLHVFRNPGGAFARADLDLSSSPTRRYYVLLMTCWANDVAVGIGGALHRGEIVTVAEDSLVLDMNSGVKGRTGLDQEVEKEDTDQGAEIISIDQEVEKGEETGIGDLDQEAEPDQGVEIEDQGVKIGNQVQGEEIEGQDQGIKKGGQDQRV